MQAVVEREVGEVVFSFQGFVFSVQFSGDRKIEVLDQSLYRTLQIRNDK